MDTPSQISSWTDQIISNWTSSGIKLQGGASFENISEFEKSLDFKLPEDFIEVYSRVDGFEDLDWNENMFSLWSLDRILKEYKEDGDTNFIGFCDFLINSHSIGFYKSDRRIYKYYKEPEAIADNFKDFILLLDSNDNLLY
ncbi:MAG: SMI1/KNR4 family protein [Ferruginibacter sp.]